MISTVEIEKAALRLRMAEETASCCAPIRELIGADNIDAAYMVQKLNAEQKLGAGIKPIGHKIGLTASVVQQQLGVDQPDFGLLWEDKQVQNGGEISVNELMQPKAEGEVAFVLDKDLAKEDLNLKDVEQAIGYLTTSIEIVGSRIKNWDIKIADTIADNASASHFVIGDQKVKLDKFDLVNCKMTMHNHKQQVTSGTGQACMGSPIHAVLWLAKKMYELEQPLKAGDLILSGSLGGMIDIQPGDKFQVVIEGLGSATAAFVA